MTRIRLALCLLVLSLGWTTPTSFVHGSAGEARQVRTGMCRVDQETGRSTRFLTFPFGGNTGGAGLIPHNRLPPLSYHAVHELKRQIYLARANSLEAKPTDRPFVLGVVADVQYGDKPDRGPRHYRTALKKLEESVSHLNEHRPAFVIQLGDIIDGQDAELRSADRRLEGSGWAATMGYDRGKSIKDLNAILAVFGNLSMPVYHVVGNHCLAVGEDVLIEKLKLDRFYYDFTYDGAEGWRFIVLDGNDGGYGIISDAQMLWFEGVLNSAAGQNEQVIVFSHYALTRDAAPQHRMNSQSADPLLTLIEDSGVVVAWLAGHDHQGGYGLRNGIHHVTIQGIVEAPENNAYALIKLYPDRINVVGFGRVPSRELRFNQGKQLRKRR